MELVCVMRHIVAERSERSVSPGPTTLSQYKIDSRFYSQNVKLFINAFTLSFGVNPCEHSSNFCHRKHR